MPNAEASNRTALSVALAPSCLKADETETCLGKDCNWVRHSSAVFAAQAASYVGTSTSKLRGEKFGDFLPNTHDAISWQKILQATLVKH